MAKSKKVAKRASERTRQPFIAQKDRPEVRLKPDMPIGELRVRDLAAILGLGTNKTPFEGDKNFLKDFFDKDFPEVAKDWVKDAKSEKFEKNEIKELKGEKHEKLDKNEKVEKREIKEFKAEKIESDGVFNPGPVSGPDPPIEQVIRAVAGLSQQVSHLANQVDELRKKSSR